MSPIAPTIGNAVHLIFPYLHTRSLRTWVFDDERHGLVEEPFIGGASESIDRVVARKCPGATRLEVAFSALPLPQPDAVLRRVWNGEGAALHGCAYHDGTQELWLCPALMHYFPGPLAPEHIYLRLSEAAV